MTQSVVYFYNCPIHGKKVGTSCDECIELVKSAGPPKLPTNLTALDIREIEACFERVLHRNGLVNGHPLTVTERQGIAIRTAIQQCMETSQLLLTVAGQTSITAMQMQCKHRAQTLSEMAKALAAEFRL